MAPVPPGNGEASQQQDGTSSDDAGAVGTNDDSRDPETGGPMTRRSSRFLSLAPRMARAARKQRKEQRALLDARVKCIKAMTQVDLMEQAESDTETGAGCADEAVGASEGADDHSPPRCDKDNTKETQTMLPREDSEEDGRLLESCRQEAELCQQRRERATTREKEAMLRFLLATHKEFQLPEDAPLIKKMEPEQLDETLDAAFRAIREKTHSDTCHRCRGRFFARELAASWPVFCRGASEREQDEIPVREFRKKLTAEDIVVEEDVTKAHELRCALRGQRKTERNDERAIALYKGALKKIDAIEEKAAKEEHARVNHAPGKDDHAPTPASKLKSQVYFCLGVMTQQGLGCTRDLALAEIYYQKSTKLDPAIAGARVNHSMILEEYAADIENDAVLGVHGSWWRWWSRGLWRAHVATMFKLIYSLLELIWVWLTCCWRTCCCSSSTLVDGGESTGKDGDENILYRRMSTSTRAQRAHPDNNGHLHDSGQDEASYDLFSRVSPCLTQCRDGASRLSRKCGLCLDGDGVGGQPKSCQCSHDDGSGDPEAIECLSDTLKDRAIREAKDERRNAKPRRTRIMQSFTAKVKWALRTHVACAELPNLDSFERTLYASHLRAMARVLMSEALHTCLENAERPKVEDADKGWNLAMAGKILLSGKADVRNETLAFTLCKCASEYQSSFAAYMLGEMYLYGTGVRRNLHKAVEYLQLSGELGFRAGFYQLGVLYEFGMGGGGAGGGGGHEIPKDSDQSLLYYEQAASRQKPRQDQEHALEATILTSRLTQSADLDTIDDTLGNAVGSLLSWALAGQAFLFSAAAEFSSSAQVDHFATLLFFLPFVGMVLAINMLLSGIVTSRRNYHRRIGPFKLYLAKRRAHDRVLRRYEAEDIGDEDLFRGTLMGLWDIVRYLLFMHPNTVRPCSKHQGSGGRRVEILFHLQTFFEYANVILSLIFLIAWAVLFAGEITSFRQGCSDWWTNACVDNEVFCNVLFQKRYSCSHDASAPSPAPDYDVES